MTWTPSDAWRDSYDAWKLATPPEYEMTGEEEDRHERNQAEDRIEWLLRGECTPDELAEIARLQEFLDTEDCPGCNVEWADQHLGDCDICHGARRVRRDRFSHPVDDDANDDITDPVTDDVDDWCPF